ncbi:hypothetical protein [Caballeronia sp. AZ7_KS35]|uniref:hypothetical protein n=1 Tax=Caballeronia sp. AZ7_KS35 TaxID=2921762 RepID=UPI00202804C5|nr:hypothetical protein [Caballeronia sp. AZ7_KS35]
MLERLNDEVFAHGPEACIPRRLTDEWLAILSRSADALLGFASGGEVSGALCFAVLIHLLEMESPNQQRMTIPLDAMHDYALRYRTELGLEELRREMGREYDPATIAMILSRQ